MFESLIKKIRSRYQIDKVEFRAEQRRSKLSRKIYWLYDKVPHFYMTKVRPDGMGRLNWGMALGIFGYDPSPHVTYMVMTYWSGFSGGHKVRTFIVFGREYVITKSKIKV